MAPIHKSQKTIKFNFHPFRRRPARPSKHIVQRASRLILSTAPPQKATHIQTSLVDIADWKISIKASPITSLSLGLPAKLSRVFIYEKTKKYCAPSRSLGNLHIARGHGYSTLYIYTHAASNPSSALIEAIWNYARVRTTIYTPRAIVIAMARTRLYNCNFRAAEYATKGRNFRSPPRDAMNILPLHLKYISRTSARAACVKVFRSNVSLSAKVFLVNLHKVYIHTYIYSRGKIQKNARAEDVVART